MESAADLLDKLPDVEAIRAEIADVVAKKNVLIKLLRIAMARESKKREREEEAIANRNPRTE